jgi:hypothetical protein
VAADSGERITADPAALRALADDGGDLAAVIGEVQGLAHKHRLTEKLSFTLPGASGFDAGEDLDERYHTAVDELVREHDSTLNQLLSQLRALQQGLVLTADNYTATAAKHHASAQRLRALATGGDV